MTSGMGIAETTPFSLNNPLPSDVKDNGNIHAISQLLVVIQNMILDEKTHQQGIRKITDKTTRGCAL